MRTRSHRRRPLGPAGLSICLLAAALLTGVFTIEQPVSAGGPFLVGGTTAPPGVPFTWNTSQGKVKYRTDGGQLGALSSGEANARVAAMFQVWEDVPTASIGFDRRGRLLDVLDGDVNGIPELNAVFNSCETGEQSPLIYDADGSLFSLLFGPYSGVIGFAGPCRLTGGGRIDSALVALNGGFLDGNPTNGELTNNEFDAVFIHEFGHFFGLDHSQGSGLNCLLSPKCASGSDDAFALPTMFPFLIPGLEETPGVHPARTLSADDIAWVSKLYPQDFDTNLGVISGTVFFSDGLTPAQGVHVIARQVDDSGTPEDESRRVVISVVSGYLFTGNPGQSVTGTNTGGSEFGSRDPALAGRFDIPVPPGAYTVETGSVYSAFRGGSRVGPLDPQIPNPGANEFWNLAESSTDTPSDSSPITVTAGATVSGIDIILNGTRPAFDLFEAAWSLLKEAAGTLPEVLG